MIFLGKSCPLIAQITQIPENDNYRKQWRAR